MAIKRHQAHFKNAMNNNLKISFGAKIPVCKCTILKKHFPMCPKSATIYEIDCTEPSDLDYIRNIKGNWEYRKQTGEGAALKFRCPEIFDVHKFYSIEDSEKNVLGLMECLEHNDRTELEFIEAHGRKIYKYIGMNLLSYASRETLKRNAQRLTIPDPIAAKFYIDVCGFKPSDGVELTMSRKGMKSLIQKTQAKTKGKSIDLRG